MFPLFPINRFSTMNPRFQVSDEANQDEEVFIFNSFKGTYIGHDLLGHLTQIDPHNSYFDFVSDYINAFPESKYFFECSFPFYMGSHVTQDELVSFYQEQYCPFVEFFQTNHPDWREYTNTECLDHFKIALEEYSDTIDNDDDGYYFNDFSQRMNETTPKTLERPHFSVYNDGNFVGFGYFPDADGNTTSFYNQMGQHGPFGYEGVRFNLQNYLYDRHRESLDFVDDVDFYLRGNIKFDFDNIDGSRYICDNDVDNNVLEVPEPAYFLFEKSHQNEKKQKRLQTDEEWACELRKRQHRERIAQGVFTINDWVVSMSQVFRPDCPSMIEIQSKFSSEPILPFQYLGLPVPRANPTDYREPLPHFNEDNEDD